MFGTANPLFFWIYAGLAFSLGIYYCFLMRRYYQHWQKLPEWSIPEHFAPQTKISILIPARNEAQNIEACLQSIFDQNYPAEILEVVVIDDHSTDATAALVQQLAERESALHLLRLSDFPLATTDQSFKKRAIELGIAHTSGDLIITTDADCVVPKKWLSLLVSFYEKKQWAFIAAPVNFYLEKTSFERFQSLDFIGMMGITGAGIQGHFQHQCNGANLAYEREAFHEVAGFSGIDQKASGDDMLLLQKMLRRYPQRIGFLKNRAATVLTPAMPTYTQFLQQRIRWASKSSDYPEWRITLRLALVFFFCWSILLCPLLLFFYLWKAAFLLGSLLLLKGLVDFFFLRNLSTYFRRSDLMNTFVSSSFYHVLYIALVGLLANVRSTYEWKGRKVR